VDWEAQGLVSKANNFSFSKVEKKSKIKSQIPKYILVNILQTGLVNTFMGFRRDRLLAIGYFQK
jgi:hypothetical protein